jgi:ABC-type sulfate transport system permease component
MTTPVLIFDRFNSFGLGYARPVAVLFVIISVLVFHWPAPYGTDRKKNNDVIL